VFDYWFVGNNVSEVRTPTQIFDYYFLCSNSSYRQPTEVFNYWFLNGNTSYRTPTQVFDYWFLCANTSISVATQVFNYWFLNGNASYRTPTQIFDYWFIGNNASIRVSAQIFDYWFSCGNCTYTPLCPTNVYHGFNVTYSIDIADSNGDVITWNISCNNTQYVNGSSYNSTISINLTNLVLGANYTIWVNTTDGSCWTNSTYYLDFSGNSSNMWVMVSRDRFNMGIILGLFVGMFLFGNILWKRNKKR